jgi:hypothetical protein
MSLRAHQVEHDRVGLMLIENIKELVFNLLGAVYPGVVWLERAGDRQILACYDHRRCRHRPLSIYNLAIASEPLAAATYMQDRELARYCGKIARFDRFPARCQAEAGAVVTTGGAQAGAPSLESDGEKPQIACSGERASLARISGAADGS